MKNDKISKLMNDPNIMTAFMQRGWSNVHEMKDWLRNNQHLQFDDLLAAIPQRDDTDTLVSVSTSDTIPSATDKVQVVGKRPEQTVLKSRSLSMKHLPWLIIMILAIVALIIIFSSGCFDSMPVR